MANSPYTILLPLFQDTEQRKTFHPYIVSATRTALGKWLVDAVCTSCGKVREDLHVSSLSSLRPLCHSCSGKRAQPKRTSPEHRPLYRTWQNMRTRCSEKGDPKQRKHYYDKGICVCDEWLTSFAAFYTWAISAGYSIGLSIDRKDPKGNYSPDNCQWIPLALQARNRHDNILTKEIADQIRNTHREQHLSPRQLADMFGLKHSSTISAVLRNKIWN